MWHRVRLTLVGFILFLAGAFAGMILGSNGAYRAMQRPEIGHKAADEAMQDLGRAQKRISLYQKTGTFWITVDDQRRITGITFEPAP